MTGYDASRRCNRKKCLEQYSSWVGHSITLARCINEMWYSYGNGHRSSLASYIITWQKYRLFPSLELLYTLRHLTSDKYLP
jgi:hypothetical protein